MSCSIWRDEVNVVCIDLTPVPVLITPESTLPIVGLIWQPLGDFFVYLGNSSGIRSSSDGEAWEYKGAPTTSSYGTGLAYSPVASKYCVPGSGLYTGAVGASTSSNLISWVSSTPNQLGLQDICWVSDRFIGMQYNINTGYSRGLYSADGTSWSAYGGYLPTLGYSVAMCYAASIDVLMVVTVNPNTAVYSFYRSADKGYTFTLVSGMPAINAVSLSWSPSLGKFAAVGSKVILESTDGSTWATCSAPTPQDTWGAVTWNVSKGFRAISFCASGHQTLIASSADGTSWSTSYLLGESSSWSCLATSDTSGIFVATSNTGKILKFE